MNKGAGAHALVNGNICILLMRRAGSGPIWDVLLGQDFIKDRNMILMEGNHFFFFNREEPDNEKLRL